MVTADRIVLAEVDSTMAEAARRAPSLSGPTWILAHQQSASRGRRGRPWKHGKGNFAATLVMPAEPATAALRSFVASLALYDAFEQLGALSLKLKWPNDVLVEGGKVAGILLEMLPTNHLCVGIGINLTNAPETDAVEPEAMPPATLNANATPEAVLDILAQTFEHWEARYTTYGFEPIREAWLSKAAKLGQPIRARTMTEEHHGTFETIDKNGCLVLSTVEGRMTISAADVYF